MNLIKKNSNHTERSTDLTVELLESQVQMLEIFDLKPEFGWTVPLGSKFQGAYQILVASNQIDIDNNNGDVWDSRT